MPFDLHPEYPPDGIPRADLEARYGDEFTARTRAMIESAGLAYGPGDVVSNTIKALALGERARDVGRHDALHDRLFAAYWAEGRDIGDTEVLVEVAGTAGIDRATVEEGVTDEGLRRRIKESTEAALGVGVTGVPAWAIDDKVLVPGVQPYDVFDRVLDRLGHRPTDS